MAAWENAPVVQDAAPSVTPAWMKAPLASVEPAEKPRSSEVGEALLGPTELLGSGILHMAPAAAHAALDLYHKITGADTPNADATVQKIDAAVQPGAAGQQLAGDIGGAVKGALQSIDAAAGGVPSAALSAVTSAGRTFLGNHPVLNDVAHNAVDVAGDVANLVPAVGATAKTGGAVADMINAARAATPEYRAAQDAPGIATVLAGSSGRQALTLRNQELGNTLMAGEAGVGAGTPLTYDSLEQARQVPNAVYGRVASSIPTGPLSENAQKAIKAAGQADGTVVTGGPDAQATIQSIRDQLLAQPMSGEQVVQNMRKLRQEGFTNIAHDDPSNQQIGRAQVDMANALEQHVADSIPPGAGVDLSQLQQARTALAKNFAVQSALKGEHVNLQAIARMQRADPDLLSGAMKDTADFANDHPEVSSLPSPTVRYTGGPSIVEDFKSVNPLTRPVGSILELVGGAAGRRMLTGDQAGALSAARGMNPTAFRDAALAEKPPGSLVLQQPEGRAFEPHQPGLLDGAPLADLISQPPRPEVPLVPPEGRAFEPHQPGLLDGAPLADLITPPQGTPAGLIVGEGKASPGKSKAKSGRDDYTKNLQQRLGPLGEILGGE